MRTMADRDERGARGHAHGARVWTGVGGGSETAVFRITGSVRKYYMEGSIYDYARLTRPYTKVTPKVNAHSVYASISEGHGTGRQETWSMMGACMAQYCVCCDCSVEQGFTPRRRSRSMYTFVAGGFGCRARSCHRRSCAATGRAQACSQQPGGASEGRVRGE